MLAPGETKRLEGRLKLKGGEPMHGAELRAVVYISDLDQPDEYLAVQRRMPVAVGERFRSAPAVRGGDRALGDDQRQGARRMDQHAQSRVGLQTVPCSISKYGNFEPSQTEPQVGDAEKLRSFISSGCLVIVLDQVFEDEFKSETFGALEGDEAVEGGFRHRVMDAISAWHLRACPKAGANRFRDRAAQQFEPPTYPW